MITLFKNNGHLLLTYQADRFNNAQWIDEKLKQNGEVTLCRTFTFSRNELLSQPTDENDEERSFLLGTLDGDYFQIKKDILGLKHDLLLDKTILLNSATFIAQRNISVFRRIDELIDEPIIVGGEKESAIPLADFELLLKTFPTSTELNHYARTRVARILKDYFGTISDAEAQLNKHLSNKKKHQATSRESIVSNFEIHKFEYVHSELENMLKDTDSYSEKQWQTKIMNLLLFVFPKYITVLENVQIKDFYTNPPKTTDRYIDLMLVDADGNIDIIEVKKPFPKALISCHTYRDNHTPKKELAGAVMQAEKYLFHLNKWGHTGEQAIYTKYQKNLPTKIKIQITNPKAIILLGRDDDFQGQQRFDFEIIRRKYANMLDIITYDDLLRRVANIIEMMRRQTSVGGSK